MIGHVVPEANRGGPLALVEDGDMISYDLGTLLLNLEVSEEELARRRSQWQPRLVAPERTWLGRYSKVSRSRSRGPSCRPPACLFGHPTALAPFGWALAGLCLQHVGSASEGAVLH
jgi:dihydroxyacid dehydratase/phosphogluconate dehydratase